MTAVIAPARASASVLPSRHMMTALVGATCDHEDGGVSEPIDPEPIRGLARECARDALSHKPPGGAILICDVDPDYFARLEQMLGRPYTELEAYEFWPAFDAALVVEATEPA